MLHRDLDSSLIAPSLPSFHPNASHPVLRTVPSVASLTSNSVVGSEATCIPDLVSEFHPLTEETVIREIKELNIPIQGQKGCDLVIANLPIGSPASSFISSCRGSGESLPSLGEAARGVSPSLQLVYGGFMITLLEGEKRKCATQTGEREWVRERGARSPSSGSKRSTGEGVQLFYSFPGAIISSNSGGTVGMQRGRGGSVPSLSPKSFFFFS